MHLSHFVAPFLVAAQAPPGLQGEETPALAFASDTVVSQSWEIEQTSEASVSTLTFGGNPQDMGSGSIRTTTRSFETTDAIETATDGALRVFERTYDTVSSETDTKGFEESETVKIVDRDTASLLEGLTVRFEYDEDTEEFNRSFTEDDAGEDEWLDELSAASYLAAALPEDEVEVGASWSLEPTFLRDLLTPGGKVNHQPAPDLPDQPEGGLAITVPSPGGLTRWDEMEGSIDVEYTSIDESEDGARIATLVVTIDVEGEFDIAEELAEEAEDSGATNEYDSGTLERSLAGEVTIQWNLDENLPHSVEGELEGTTAFEASWSMDTGQFELDAATERETDDSYSISASFKKG